MILKLTLWGSEGLYEKEVHGVRRLERDNSNDLYAYKDEGMQQYAEGEVESYTVEDDK